jgi:hypothetical protein
MANVFIDILAEFTGKKAFKQAEASTEKLSKNVKKLAGSLGVAFGGQQILAYAKRSVKAAAEDQAAQASLAQTLKNLGYENESTAESVNGFISNLERQTGVMDDQLRPAMDRLLRATGSVTKSQELMGLALDISAGTGKDLGQVTQSLQKAYLGQTQALGRLGVGLSKAELSSSNFEEITSRLTVLFAGQAQRQADSFKGSIDKLGVAANNVSEIIGTGLIDALKAFGDDDSVSTFATDMENTALYVADVVRGMGELVAYIKQAGDASKNIPVLNKFIDAVQKLPMFLPTKLVNKLGSDARKIAEQQQTSSTALSHLAELQSNYAVATLKTNTKLTAEQIKQLKAARLKAALEKANLALLKGEEVFDMEKIQNEAALKNQTEQLGKATNGSQILQIANDTARLNVKKSILALEDAMASKDEAAITAATKKLNADIGILGALTGQDLKLANIKTILESLKPKDLINLTNLEAALDLLGKINLATGGSSGGSSSTGVAASGIPVNDFIAPISTSGGSIAAILEYAESATARANAFADLLDMQNAADAAAFNSSSLGTSAGNTIIINTGVGDPNAIAEAIDQVLTDAFQRGTLRQYATP